MPQISITNEAYETLRATVIAQRSTYDAVVLHLLKRSLPPFDPQLLTAYDFDGLLIAYYDGRFAGVATYVRPPSKNTDEQTAERTNQTGGGGRGSRWAQMDWCDWFAPIVAGRRTS